MMLMKAAKQKLVVEQGHFLGEFELYYQDEPYGRGYVLVAKCKDGRSFAGESQGIGNDPPFVRAFRNLQKFIESAYCKTLPRMDRIMRELYK